jgi:hypothetical protein
MQVVLDSMIQIINVRTLLIERKSSEKNYAYLQVPTVRNVGASELTKLFFASRDERNKSSIFHIDLTFDDKLNQPRAASLATPFLDYKETGIDGSLGVFPGCFVSIGGTEIFFTSNLYRTEDGRLSSKIIAYRIQKDDELNKTNPQPVSILNDTGDEISFFFSTPTVINIENGKTVMWLLVGNPELNRFPSPYELCEARLVDSFTFQLTGRRIRGNGVSSCLSKPSFVYDKITRRPSHLMFSIRDELTDYRLANVEFDSIGEISENFEFVDCKVIAENQEMSCYGEFLSLNNRNFVIFSGNRYGYESLLIGDLIDTSLELN